MMFISNILLVVHLKAGLLERAEFCLLAL